MEAGRAAPDGERPHHAFSREQDHRPPGAAGAVHPRVYPARAGARHLRSAPAAEEGPRELTSFTDEMRHHGIAARSDVLDQGIIGSPRRGGEAGNPAAGTRLPPAAAALADDEPVGLQTAYVPLSSVPGITDIAFTDASLYEVFRSRYALLPAGEGDPRRRPRDQRRGPPAPDIRRITGVCRRADHVFRRRPSGWRLHRSRSCGETATRSSSIW